MNISKFSAATKKEMLALYKLGIPVRLLAELFKVSWVTVTNSIPKKLKEEFELEKEDGLEKKLFLLKLYAWLVYDEVDCIKNTEIPCISGLKQILFKHLKLEAWENVIDGAKTILQSCSKNIFESSFPDNYKALINNLFPTLKIEHSKKEILENALKLMHIGEIPFPESSEINKPAVALEEFIEKYILPHSRPRITFDYSIVEFIDVCFEKMNDRTALLVKATFGITKETIEHVCEQEDITMERGRQIKERGLNIIERNIYSLSQNPLSAALKEIKEKRKLQLELQEIERKEKNLSEDISCLKNYLVTIATECARKKIQVSEDVQRIISAYSDGTKGIPDTLSVLLGTPIEELDLSVRLFGILKAAKWETLKEIVQREEVDFFKLRNYGQKSHSELEQVLLERNLSFGMIL